MQESFRDKEETIRQLSLEMTQRVKRTTWISLLVSAFLSVLAAGWLIFSIATVTSLEQRKRLLNEEIADLEQRQGALLNDLGWSKERLTSARIEAPDVRASLEASSARRQAAAQSKASAHAGTTIQVFSRDVDRDVVAGALRELGFKVEIRNPNPAITSSTATNAIWFGPQIGTDQVKLVAYTLIRAGVKLYVIEPFQDPRSRNFVIQVGSQVGGVMRSAPFSVQEIQNANTFG